MRKLGYIFIILILTANASIAQQDGVGIGTDYPDAEAILDIQTTQKGILIPRMTTVQRDAISVVNGQDDGLLIYNLTTDEFNYWDGTQWVAFPGTGSDADWFIESGTTAPTSINDNIFTNGNVGIGNNSPSYALDVSGDIRINDGTNGHDIYGGPSGSIFLYSNSGVAVQLENDGGSSGYFRVRNRDSVNVFRVNHSGLTTIDGDLVFESDGNQIRFEGSDPVDILLNTSNTGSSLDIESQGTVDIVLDRDNNNAGSVFTVKRNDDGSAAANALFAVPEDDALLVYPFGTGDGETGGIRFRELAASPGGANYVGLRAPNSIGSNFFLTLPSNPGALGQYLITDGTGVLSWMSPRLPANGNLWDQDTDSGYLYPSSINDRVGIGTITPSAKLEVNGYTKLGISSPAIQMKVLKGTSSPLQLGHVSLAHGLDSNKILSVDIAIESSKGIWIPPSYTSRRGFLYNFQYDMANVIVENINRKSFNLLNRPIKVLITYEE